ncbi:MAG: MetQ/NlpA family ABC transporter substrate-binding protein [Lachnospiraceae bacterium]|nr:MetQ/NlpA family ABC transporter substrate-binding protein [Lachnospiraceae bacterium]
MKKNILQKLGVLALTGVLSVSLLAACGGASDSSSDAQDTAADAQTADEAGDAEEDTAEPVTLKIAASPTPHAEILAYAADALAEEGITLEVDEFEDYVQPNNVVDDGTYDANYFQHTPYLDSFNEENGTDVVSAGKIHYEPFAIYPGTKTSLEEVADGDSIAVPNDTTNEARALLLLQDNGLITLNDGVGLEATVNDIAENPHNLKIEELEAAQVSRAAQDVAFLAVNGNYAQEAGWTVADNAIAVEKSDSEAASTYANIIAVKNGNENNEAIQKLVEVLRSDDVQNWIEQEYNGGVVPYTGD